MRTISAVGALGLTLAISAPAAAQEATVEFTVSGNSTIRGWTCAVMGAADVSEGGGTAAPGFDSGVQTATLTVQVADFECPEDEMKEHLLEAMRAREFPEITFRLTDYETTGTGAATTGSLTILDTTREVSVPLSLTPTDDGVQIAGELPLDMTEYGVEPPRVMLGLLVVRPEIRIEFSGVVSP